MHLPWSTSPPAQFPKTAPQHSLSMIGAPTPHRSLNRAGCHDGPAEPPRLARPPFPPCPPATCASSRTCTILHSHAQQWQADATLDETKWYITNKAHGLGPRCCWRRVAATPLCTGALAIVQSLQMCAARLPGPGNGAPACASTTQPAPVGSCWPCCLANLGRLPAAR